MCDSFTIPKNTKNPLEGVVDKNTTMTIMENKDDVKPPPSKVPKLRHMLVIPRGGMFPIELWVEE